MIKILLCLCALSAVFALPTIKDELEIAEFLNGLTGFGKLILPNKIDDISGAGEDPIIDDISAAGEDLIPDNVRAAWEEPLPDDVSGAGEDPIIDDISAAGEDPIPDNVRGAWEEPLPDNVSGAGEDYIIDDISGAGEDPIIDDVSGAGEDFYYGFKLNTIIDDISGAGEDPIIDDTSAAGEDPIIDDISAAGEDPIPDNVRGAWEEPLPDDVSGAGEDRIIDNISAAGEDPIPDNVRGAWEEPLPDDVSGAGEDIIEGEQFFDAWADVEFQLYTRSNPSSPQILKLNDLNSIRNSNFVNSRLTRYIIHGWNNNGQSDVNRILREAYLQKGDFNVISLDWGKGANTINYDTARQRIKEVSDVGAAFIDFMANQAGASVANVQIVGHSLGGHTSGLIGKKVKAGKIPKIVGLDPASVGFSVGSANDRLDKADANYVEVVHTSSLGMSSPIGHVDHYPNGFSSRMPGCGVDVSSACSHGRAYDYFAESITSTKGFAATRCRDHLEIINDKSCTSRGTAKFGGEPLNTSTPQGSYFFETNASSPYAP